MSPTAKILGDWTGVERAKEIARFPHRLERACVLAKGLVMCPYILASLRKRATEAKATFKWSSELSKNDLFLFEAFVTHEKADHIGCAKLAIAKLKEKIDRGQISSDLGSEPCFNLLAAMLLQTRWPSDIGLLQEQCIVIRHRGTA